ncbi:MAG: hypothetical protein RIB58_13195 [Phycisphaerales bacterium]
MNQNRSIQVHRSAAQNASPFPATADVQRELVQMAREHAESTSGKLARHAVRLQIEPQLVNMSVIHPGGTNSASQSILFDIGPGGAAVLYPGFVYNQTECYIHMASTDGKPAMLGACAAWCRFLSRGVHCLGMKWLEPIDVRRFVPSSHWSELGVSRDEHARAEVSGRVLSVGFDAMEAALVQLALQGVDVELDAAEDAGATLDALQETSFDLLIINAEASSFDADALLDKLRLEGFCEPVILVSDRRADGSVREAEHLRHLSKPIDSESLIAAVRELMLTQSESNGGSSPVVSTLADQPAMASAIGTFIVHAQRHSETLRGAISTGNAQEARKSLLLLLNTSSGFGFATLGDVAGEAMKALDASGSLEEAAPQIKRFMRIVGRLQAPQSEAGAA